jgi:hypothetical protein
MLPVLAGISGSTKTISKAVDIVKAKIQYVNLRCKWISSQLKMLPFLYFFMAKRAILNLALF